MKGILQEYFIDTRFSFFLLWNAFIADDLISYFTNSETIKVQWQSLPKAIKTMLQNHQILTPNILSKLQGINIFHMRHSS